MRSGEKLKQANDEMIIEEIVRDKSNIIQHKTLKDIRRRNKFGELLLLGMQCGKTIPIVAIIALVLNSFMHYGTLLNEYQDTIKYTNAMDDVTIHTRHKNETTPPTVFFCHKGDGNGMREDKKVMQSALPDFQFVDLSGIPLNRGYEYRQNLKNRHTNEYDIFMHPMYDLGQGCSTAISTWLLTRFRGEIVVFSSESEYHHPFRRTRAGQHVFGPIQHPLEGDLVLYYLQTVWWDRFQGILSPHVMTKERPKGNRTHFLVYSQSNCIDFRDSAFGLLSTIKAVHYSGRCKGNPPTNDWSNISRVESGISLGNWWENVSFNKSYRFCLVLEHERLHNAYVTEKILMAFAGGCIPIYHGPRIINDLFNEKAFVMWDLENPQNSVDFVRDLESNESLYLAMINEPILSNGTATIEKYFSFSDEIGNGKLKKVIRRKLGLQNF